MHCRHKTYKNKQLTKWGVKLSIDHGAAGRRVNKSFAQIKLTVKSLTLYMKSFQFDSGTIKRIILIGFVSDVEGFVVIVQSVDLVEARHTTPVIIVESSTKRV